MPDIKRSEQRTQFSPSSRWLLIVTDTGHFPLCNVPGHFRESPSNPRVSRPQRLRWIKEVQQRLHQTLSEETFQSCRGRENLPGALRTKATHGLWLSNCSNPFFSPVRPVPWQECLRETEKNSFAFPWAVCHQPKSEMPPI